MSFLVGRVRRHTMTRSLITAARLDDKLRSAGFLPFKVGPFVINKYLGGGAETLICNYPVSYQIFTY